MNPKGVLIDYGGTLFEEISFDNTIGAKWLFEQSTLRPKNVTLEMVLDRPRQSWAFYREIFCL